MNCWCAGVSEICDSSDFRYTDITPGISDSFVLVSRKPDSDTLSQLRPAVVNHSGSQRSHAELRGQPAVEHDCYWYLPDRFNGNKLRYYGGNLRFTSIVDGQTRNKENPDIIIRGNGRSIEFSNESRDVNFDLKFAEDQGWMTDKESATRDDIMTVLAKIDSILIRACSGRTTFSSLSKLSIEYANGTATSGRLATAVEKCTCPPGYRGISCEECQPGFYRTEGPGIGRCEKCKCGGNDEECEDFTGTCKVKIFRILDLRN